MRHNKIIHNVRKYHIYKYLLYITQSETTGILLVMHKPSLSFTNSQQSQTV